MAKCIMEIIYTCAMCRYKLYRFGFKGAKGEQGTDRWVCSHPETDGRLIALYTLKSVPIPDWCPLPDAPEAEHE